MSTTTTPKRPPSSSDRRTPASNSATNRSPTRMAAQTMSPASRTNDVNRARSVRNGAPVSARSAARKPAAGDVDDDAKAELQAKLDELQERLQQAEMAYEESKKHADILQIKFDQALQEQGLLEESVHEHTERIEELELEKKEGFRARRELEQIYEAERAQAMREREQVDVEREEMAHSMQRLRETLAQRELRDRTGLEDERRPSMSRTSSLRSDPSPNPDGRRDTQFAPPSSLQRSDSRSSSRLVMQKDKIIESLRLELAEAQIKAVELENRGGGTLHQLEKDMYDIKIQNARLMEENESFHLLLSEKTLNGDLAHSDLLRPPSNSESHSRPSSRHPRQRTSLADELEGHDSLENEAGEGNERRLQAEVYSLKDQNKALTLYINNIVSRLLQHDQFEAILDKTPDLMAGPPTTSRKSLQVPEMEKELPPPPSAMGEEEQQPPSLLQRAGSVLRRKPGRPVSYVPPAAALQLPPETEHPRLEEPTRHENPSTAPSIPLTRTASTRAGANGHRRSRSDWPAASVVTNMYKGPSPGPSSGPYSPGLSSPPGRTSFFPLGARAPSSGGNIPTISDIEKNKENLHEPHRDSKVSSLGASPERVSTRNSARNSVQSNPGERNDFEPATISESSNPSSPPRSTTSSGERERPSGAIMMGSKPRPLRLVQEADEEKAKKAGNRGSWFGWMNKGTPGGSGFGGSLPSWNEGAQ